ncbi:pyocin knob domain-containing protein [Citrobacter freundii]
MSENNYGALMMRGALPANANLNSYGPVPDFIGIWSRSTNTNTTAAYNFPEDSGQGILEVMAGGLQGGTQRYTTGGGNVYTRSLTAAWNGTDGPWGAWLMAGVNSMPGYFAGDMNTLVTPGVWSTTGAVTNGPLISGQTSSVIGICQVYLRSSANTLVQVYTTTTNSATTTNRTWQRTLNGITWSPWELLGTKALNDLGMGLATMPVLSTFDWQQADFLSGATYLVSFNGMTNTPPGISYPSNTNLWIRVVGTQGTYVAIEIIPMTNTVANYKVFEVMFNGSKGSRSFYTNQVFTSADTIPIANGGTGSPTAAGGLANLGGAPLASPALTGTPTAPTAAQTVNNTQIATTAFVKAAITALINNSPAALDTLQELANALGNDANFSTTVLNALAGKQPLNAILTSLSGAVTAANRLPYFNDVNKVAVTELTAFMRGLLGKEDFTTALAHLGVNSAGRRNVGTGFSAGGSEIPDMSSFEGVKAANGRKYLPGGVLLQWGTVVLKSAPAGTTVGNFNIAFPGACHQIFVTHDNPQTNILCFGSAQMLSASQFRVNAIAINADTFTMVPSFDLTLRWFAIGG